MAKPVHSEKNTSRVRKAASGVRKPAVRKTSARRTSTGKHPKSKQKAVSRPMPTWVRWMVAAGLAVVLTVGFYWCFIRPYASTLR